MPGNGDDTWKGIVITKLDSIESRITRMLNQYESHVEDFNAHLRDCSDSRSAIRQDLVRHSGCLKQEAIEMGNLNRAMNRTFRFLVGTVVLILAYAITNILLKR